MTFPKYRKQKFLTKFEFKFFNPTPSWRGGIKIEVIKKLVRDPMLLNMIFKANKNKNKSRRWVVYLKNWASYSDFCESSRTKSQFLKEIKSQNLYQFLRLSSEFLHVISIFIEFQTLNSNMVSQSILYLVYFFYKKVMLITI